MPPLQQVLTVVSSIHQVCVYRFFFVFVFIYCLFTIELWQRVVAPNIRELVLPYFCHIWNEKDNKKRGTFIELVKYQVLLVHTNTNN